MIEAAEAPSRIHHGTTTARVSTGTYRMSPSHLDRRSLLLGLAALAGTAAFPVQARARYEAILSRDGRPVRGVPGYATLAEALAAAPDNGTRPFRIFVPKGEWRGRSVVTKPFIQLIGQSRDASVIVTNASRRDIRPGEQATAAILVQAPDFHAANLTIANDFDYVGNMPAPVDFDRTGATGAQAQALMLDDGSDRAYFHNVRFTGYQDTLWLETGRSLFRRCEITGCTDFIYGGSRALFERCNVVSRLRPGQDFNGFIAAPDTDVDQPYGLVFVDCSLRKERGVAAQTVALGRPWRHRKTIGGVAYGLERAVGQSVFIRCWMDDHIVPEGWYRMHYTTNDGGRAFLEPEEARFFEYESRGPGAGAASSRRRMLTADEAARFTPANILDGWMP
jgi:pectinesterase